MYNWINKILNSTVVKAGIGIGDRLKQQNGYNPPQSENTAQKASPKVLGSVVSKTKAPLKTVQICHPIKRSPVVITSPFGWRTLYPNGVAKKVFHNGSDYRSWDNPHICAVEDGVIEKYVAPDAKYPDRFALKNGKWVEVAPKGRAWTPYVIIIGKHTKNRYVWRHVKMDAKWKAGMIISAGTVFGRTGNFGYSMGEHLHFEFYNWNEKLKKYDDASDPMAFFRKAGVKENVFNVQDVPITYFLNN